MRYLMWNGCQARHLVWAVAMRLLCMLHAKILNFLS